MSESNTNTVQEQVAQAAQLSAEQQAAVLDEAKKELSLVVKALRGGNRENAVSQYLAGLHGLRFINLCRKGGKARSFATGELAVAGQERRCQPDPQDLCGHQSPPRRHHAPSLKRQSQGKEHLGGLG